MVAAGCVIGGSREPCTNCPFRFFLERVWGLDIVQAEAKKLTRGSVSMGSLMLTDVILRSLSVIDQRGSGRGLF